MDTSIVGAILGAIVAGLIARPLFYMLFWRACAKSYDRRHKPPCFCGKHRRSDGGHIYGCPQENYTNPFHGLKWQARKEYR